MKWLSKPAKNTKNKERERKRKREREEHRERKENVREREKAREKAPWGPLDDARSGAGGSGTRSQSPGGYMNADDMQPAGAAAS